MSQFNTNLTLIVSNDFARATFNQSKMGSGCSTVVERMLHDPEFVDSNPHQRLFSINDVIEQEIHLLSSLLFHFH